MKLSSLLQRSVPERAPKVLGWNVTNRDFKRNLVTYTRHDGGVMITFGENSWVAADPRNEFETLDDATNTKYSFEDVLNRFKHD